MCLNKLQYIFLVRNFGIFDRLSYRKFAITVYKRLYRFLRREIQRHGQHKAIRQRVSAGAGQRLASWLLSRLSAGPGVHDQICHEPEEPCGDTRRRH